jgi:hypothetical protein
MSSLLLEVTAMGAHLRLRLEEYAGQVKAKNRSVKDIQKGTENFFRRTPALRYASRN